MEALKMIPFIALMLAISGITLGATALTLGKFSDSMDKCKTTSLTFNSSIKSCCFSNDTCGDSVTNVDNAATDEYLTVFESTTAIVDVSEQMPTVGIIAIMVIIISLIVGIFAYIKFFS